RLHDLSLQSLWFDEAFSWRMTQFPWHEIASRAAEDNNPPLYFLLLKGWVSVFGDTVFSIRSLSAVLGVATILGAYGFAVEVSRGFPGKGLDKPDSPFGTGLLSAALLALSIYQIAHAREVRMYTLGSLLAVLSSWVLLIALRGTRSPFRTWSAYVLLALGLAYTHNYGLFTVAAQAGYALIFCLTRRDRPDWLPRLRRAAWAFAVLALAYVPWIPIVLRQQGQVAHRFWTTPLSLGSVCG